MDRTLYSLAFLTFTQLLTGCGGNAARPDHNSGAGVSSSHSIYIEGGVLKILSNEVENVLFVYIRPESLGLWAASGGGGGSQDKPWLFSSAASWALGNEKGEHSRDAPRKSFSFIFNSRDMTLTIDSKTYAVRKGDLIVIPLDSDWRASAVKSGLKSLRGFSIPGEDPQHLFNEVRKHYSGSATQPF